MFLLFIYFSKRKGREGRARFEGDDDKGGGQLPVFMPVVVTVKGIELVVHDSD